MTYADYAAGTEVDTASFEYDGAGRLTRIRDWIDDVDGLQYGYDELGRLTSVTDYDGSALSYVYDAVGRVTSMTDYHSNVTSYSYTNLNQLDTITAPGNRVWDFDYNANGFSHHEEHEGHEAWIELSNRVIGCAIEVHRNLGPGLLESTYEQCLAAELSNAGLHSQLQDRMIHSLRLRSCTGPRVSCRMRITWQGRRLFLKRRAMLGISR